MIQFYLEEVMPQAESQGPDTKEPVNSLGEKLKTLRLQLRRCVSSRPAPSLAALGLFFRKLSLPDTQQASTMGGRSLLISL